MNNIYIKYHDSNMPRLNITEVGDWIDLYSMDSIKYKQGDVFRISLGVSMRLPFGYEAHIRPRSSTFSKYGVLLTNSVGVIDNAYCGDNDIWKAEFVALRDGEIAKYDRLVQFRIFENQPRITFLEVDYLGKNNRGGYGSTGRWVWN